MSLTRIMTVISMRFKFHEESHTKKSGTCLTWPAITFPVFGIDTEEASNRINASQFSLFGHKDFHLPDQIHISYFNGI